MNREPRDPTLERVLREISSDPSDARVDWPELRRSINERAASELTRRRLRTRRLRIVIPTAAAAAAAAVAASFALFLVASRTPDLSNAGVSPREPAVERVSIDELLDADVPDGLFRAVLFGSAEADDLLLIAAADGQP